jgi:hypothetical protein
MTDYRIERDGALITFLSERTTTAIGHILESPAAEG